MGSATHPSPHRPPWHTGTAAGPGMHPAAPANGISGEHPLPAPNGPRRHRDGNSPAGRGGNLQQEPAGGWSRGSAVPRGASCAGRPASAHAYACTCTAEGACVRAHCAHTAPLAQRWPLNFLTRQSLPSAMGRCGAAASRAPTPPWWQPNPGGSSHPRGCGMAADPLSGADSPPPRGVSIPGKQNHIPVHRC